MNKTIQINLAEKLSKKFKLQKKKIVVCGGCFDILHIGHIKFLQKTKEKADILFLLLESDENVKKIKGSKRPINSQKDRAEILSSISYVDYIIKLPKTPTNKDYDEIIRKINPDIIATTKGDPNSSHNIRQAKLINAKVLYVIQRINNKSTTSLAKKISRKF